MRTNRGDTNNPTPPRNDNQDAFHRIARFRVIDYVTDYGAGSARTDLVSAHRYNGNSIGTKVYVIKVGRSTYAANDDLWAVLPDGKTNLTYAKDGTHSAVPVLWMDIAGTGGLVPAGTLYAVNLTQTGGSAGDSGASCSFTYTVVNKLGVTLLMGAAPECARGIGKKIAATRGTAYDDADGNPVLFWANEPDGAVERNCVT